jgi:hypothetical protein
MTEAGMPAGVFNVVQGKGDVGQALASHPGMPMDMLYSRWLPWIPKSNNHQAKSFNVSLHAFFSLSLQ